MSGEHPGPLSIATKLMATAAAACRCVLCCREEEKRIEEAAALQAGKFGCAACIRLRASVLICSLANVAEKIGQELRAKEARKALAEKVRLSLCDSDLLSD